MLAAVAAASAAPHPIHEGTTARGSQEGRAAVTQQSQQQPLPLLDQRHLALHPGHCHPDLIVIGAGVAGCAVAHACAAQGRRVLLLERDWRTPDRIVGELMQPAGVQALQELGMLDTIEGIDGIDCHGYAIFKQGRSVHLPYPTNVQPGRSFHHGQFISKLRQKATASTSHVLAVEATVTDLLSCPRTQRVMGVTCSFKSGTTRNFYAPFTVIADGCFSKFRKQIITKPIQVPSYFVGLVLEDCPLPFPNHGHVLLANPSPILLYQIGTRDTRILVDIPEKLPSIANGDLKHYMQEVVGPQLPPKVLPCFLHALETQRMRSMPNSWLPPTASTQKGALLLGDAMNMRHPLTGGGMTVALWDVVHLTRLLAPEHVPNLADDRAVERQVRQLHWKRKELSSVINILAQALYAIFSAKEGDVHMRLIQDACFEYFQLGGDCLTVPISLLSGLRKSPMTLLHHFFRVAFYGIYLLWSRRPAYAFAYTAVESVLVLYTATMVIGPVLLSEMGK